MVFSSLAEIPALGQDHTLDTCLLSSFLVLHRIETSVAGRKIRHSPEALLMRL